MINVWSSAKSVAGTANEMECKQLSTGFAASALTVAFRMQSTERRIENSIRRGFPLGEFWIQTDLEGIDDSLRLAAFPSPTMLIDKRCSSWKTRTVGCKLDHWLVDANRKMQLGDYYMSASALDNDTRFQSGVACTKFFGFSMLASRRLADDNSCL